MHPVDRRLDHVVHRRARPCTVDAEVVRAGLCPRDAKPWRCKLRLLPVKAACTELRHAVAVVLHGGWAWAGCVARPHADEIILAVESGGVDRRLVRRRRKKLYVAFAWPGRRDGELVEARLCT